MILSDLSTCLLPGSKIILMQKKHSSAGDQYYRFRLLVSAEKMGLQGLFVSWEIMERLGTKNGKGMKHAVNLGTDLAGNAFCGMVGLSSYICNCRFANVSSWTHGVWHSHAVPSHKGFRGHVSGLSYCPCTGPGCTRCIVAGPDLRLHCKNFEFMCNG